MSYGGYPPRRNLLGSGCAWRLIPLGIGLMVMLVTVVRGCDDGPYGRHQLTGMSLGQEAQLGAQAFQQVLGESPVERDPQVNAAVVRIARQLIGASQNQKFLERVKLPARDFEWKVSVVRSPQANAFCLPGGKIVVYTGILPVSETEAGLAVVMGHEISPALARHGSERMGQERLFQIGQMATAGSIMDMDPTMRRQVMAAFGMGARYGLLLPYGRKHESEADRMGLDLMAIAGYDPVNAPKFWQRMTAASGGRGAPPEFASTHPSHERRIADLTQWQADARPLYESSPRLREQDQRLPVPYSRE